MKTRIVFLVILVSTLCFARDKKKETDPPPVSLSELDSAVMAKLKAQIETDNARLETIQQMANPIVADGRDKQGKLDAIVKRIKDQYESEYPGFVLNYDVHNGEGGTFTPSVKPEPKKEEVKPEVTAPSVEEKK